LEENKKGMTYAGVGVNYAAMDPFKRMAQVAGRDTAINISRFGFKEVEMSRGESAYLIETPDSFLAHVEEGLGTKNLVADAMYQLTGESYYDHVAQCTVAMIVNDMITLGALPLSVAMHLAVGISDWFNDEVRCRDLVNGWKNACNLARCVWGGGETPTLKGVVVPEAIVLSGSAMGIITPKERLITANVQEGDAIVLIMSSGIHANGLTLARKIAEELPDGYLTRLEDGCTYGGSLLDPTIIYVPLIEDCLKAEIPIHYTANITGHGWRKLMRAPQTLAYVIDQIPEPQPVFNFIQKHGNVSDEEMYGNFNMGAGFAIFVAEKDAEKVVGLATALGMESLIAGLVYSGDEKKVVILQKNLTYYGSSLGVR